MQEQTIPLVRDWPGWYESPYLAPGSAVSSTSYSRKAEFPTRVYQPAPSRSRGYCHRIPRRSGCRRRRDRRNTPPWPSPRWRATPPIGSARSRGMSQTALGWLPRVPPLASVGHGRCSCRRRWRYLLRRRGRRRRSRRGRRRLSRRGRSGECGDAGLAQPLLLLDPH